MTRWKWQKEMYFYKGRVATDIGRIDPFFHAHEEGEDVAACGCNKHIFPHIERLINTEEPNEGSRLCPNCIEIVKEKAR